MFVCLIIRDDVADTAVVTETERVQSQKTDFDYSAVLVLNQQLLKRFCVVLPLCGVSNLNPATPSLFVSLSVIREAVRDAWCSCSRINGRVCR